ncbi:MAG: hypothetical protein KME30_01025 [Iphinoe sp. HA4291-MV1]|nr:hypothetical protein [Iphinoe sp. HA4291-MV1]
MNIECTSAWFPLLLQEHLCKEKQLAFKSQKVYQAFRSSLNGSFISALDVLVEHQG